MPASKSTKRELPPEKAKREAKLQDMLTKLKAGEHVQNRRLQKWLSPAEYEQLHDAWDSQKEIRQELADKPDAIKRYDDLLKQADFLHSKAEGHSSKGRHKTAKKFFNQAESAYERALEHLDENLNVEPALSRWIDREFNWTAGGAISTDPDSVPRVTTSRSRLKQGGGLVRHTQSKRDVKIDVVERAIDHLYRDPEADAKFIAKMRARKQLNGKSPEERD